jgi:exodeoxyribonuclease V beta subunit
VTIPVIDSFDVCGDLPTGTTVLEASAGTGKTFTIAALAARYVAEGAVDLAELMLVTFSRAATQELRDRVRAQLVTVERGLANPLAARRQSHDRLLQLLADAPAAEVLTRRRRLTRALADFDAATIATTHGFCQQMLAGLGMAGDLEDDTIFVENIDDVITEVVADLYLRKFSGVVAKPLIDYPTALEVARAAMNDRQADLVPNNADDGTAAQLRFGLAQAVRHTVDARKRTLRLLDYDDLLTRLRDALTDPARGREAVERIRSRYAVVLVDEFQDTDPVQWEILQRSFHGHTTLVLIGDPKQAIYAFRGADLVTYLHAVGQATEKQTLSRNWRSDSDLLAAFDLVFGGAAMGSDDIFVRPVDAEHTNRRLTNAGAPLRIRVATRLQAGVVDGGKPKVGETRPLIAHDVAADVVATLSGPATLSIDEIERPVSPHDIAVIVRTNQQAALVREALATAHVPAVVTGTRSVFRTDMAKEWLTLLRAVEQPHRSGLARAAALTCFLGWTPERLADADDVSADELGPRLRGWRDLLAERGVAAMLEVIVSTQGVIERLLGRVGGERDLTDLRHIGEALHAAAVADRLGPAALVEWLQRRITEALQDATDARSWRLDSDADAVQIVTIHASKGLEFPIVYVPFGWDRNVPQTPDPLRLHDSSGQRLLDVGGPGNPSYAANRPAHDLEEYGEDLRLLYVAMTRAQCQVVASWAPGTTTTASPLHRLLFSDVIPGGLVPSSASLPDDDMARLRLEALAARSSGTITVESVSDHRAVTWAPDSTAAATLTAATFSRSLDLFWRRTSYSGLTAGLYEAAAAAPGVGSEPEVTERQDEPPEPSLVPGAGASDDSSALWAVASPMADLPAGAAFGTLVHEVLEVVDTRAPDLGEELLARCRDAATRFGAAIDADALTAGLLPVMDTPLGRLAGGIRLRDIVPADRLAEMTFELPLAGGDAADGVVAGTVTQIGALLRTHLPATDPLASYPDVLDAAGIGWQQLSGYLTGSLDAVVRVYAESGDPRYVVVDYKTNWLGSFGPDGADPLSAWHYRPDAMAAEMLHAHYPLQALLYSVALHRFLRWRQPGYDPATHLGGALYLFVRGMCGEATPVVDGMPCGVFDWQLPTALIVDVSRLLDEGGTT